jgi:uncharacterized membrane protein (DUF106 family)
VDLAEIRQQLKALQEEIAELRTANQAYLGKRLHSGLEVHAQKQRELRLQQILDELARLTRTKI